jgi:uncharacterized lipoprotein YmbA
MKTVANDVMANATWPASGASAVQGAASATRTAVRHGRRGPLRRALGAGMVTLAVLAIAGCASSPKSSFYTLSGDAPPALVGAPRYSVAVMVASIPDSIDRPQVVLRTGNGRVEIREEQRWAGSLKDDIAQTFADDLARSLPDASVYTQSRAGAGSEPTYRLAIGVQRFDSVLGQRADVDLQWTLTEKGQPRLQCRQAASIPASAGADEVEGLVAAHRKAIEQIAERAAAAIVDVRTAPAGTTGLCAG